MAKKKSKRLLNNSICSFIVDLCLLFLRPFFLFNENIALKLKLYETIAEGNKKATF